MMNRLFALIMALILILGMIPAIPAYAQDGSYGSSNYIYNSYNEAVPSPPAYVHTASYAANMLEGIKDLKSMKDAFVKNGKIYILKQSQLIILDMEMNVLSAPEGYVGLDGRNAQFDSNSGIFVCDEGDYYICEENRSRILHFDADNNLIRVLDNPNIKGVDATVKYRPSKMVVDEAGRMFVVAKGMYEGIVQLNSDGQFATFYGVNQVQYSLWNLLWRRLATSEQRSKQSLWLPTDFTNVCIDPDGFVFATVQSSSAAQSVMRLNAKGQNILRVAEDDVYPSGDLWMNQTSKTGAPVGASEFISVDVNDFGVYICLDATRSRVFAYNEDGKLLFIFGGKGNREGYFRGPVDAVFIDDGILVLDATAESIEVFSVTEYGNALMKAVEAQYLYDYQIAEDYWREALKYNQNLFIAYSGIGRSLLRRGQHDEALRYLELGSDRKYYSKAYEKVRNDTLEVYMMPVVLSIIGLVIVLKLFKVTVKVIKKKRGGKAGRKGDAK